ncbi:MULTISPECIES: YcjX family protein [unclassified Pseudovibrio]|uniref:YcjX family protein n=1 Tax=unclassified Pseudovibrio TaxID=2627060 RepID=UPI0007AED7F9|nr:MULTISPECIES: YcjX family protein [unclassified Pseudovibrio]KZK93201.1 hypothetical protein PsW74_05356 [Pseudovibrio sp. W74]KZL07092.1 hypothetical protein PsAD14_04559 [Pseudovibrio sp. Ad14]
MSPLNSLFKNAKLALTDAQTALDNLTGSAIDLTVPTVRLGVTGLARSGKTVFISALVHNLIAGGRLPLLDAAGTGRLARAYLQPQPDDNVPRFNYEQHVESLTKDRLWPESTHQISELRLTIEYESATFLNRQLGGGKLHLDIVDYPGEWLLDLVLLRQDFRQFSEEALRRAKARPDLSEEFLSTLARYQDKLHDEFSEDIAKDLASTFTTYLSRCRDDENALSMLPPGRFLMPGDMKGTPALTFAPLNLGDTQVKPKAGTLLAIMERRYEAYRKHVVRPFFKNHFAKLDRQIVLVDALTAINAGPEALDDLSGALTEIMGAFRPGKASWLFSIVSRKIDRILFAATKADHLRREDHDHLELLLKQLVERAINRAEFSGASVETLALASVRATRQATVHHDGAETPALLGTPMPEETIGPMKFDGEEEAAIFPGDLPDDLSDLFSTEQSHGTPEDQTALKYVRFRPPKLERTAEGLTLSLPHIRLDSAMEFLLGDKLA